MNSAPSTSALFTPTALRYFEEHAISAEVAAAVGVSEVDGVLVFPYKNSGFAFERRRPLNGNRTLQPRGRQLCPWTPFGTDGVALVCEGESDALAVASVLYEVRDLEIFDRADLPPALKNVVPVAIPGAGAAHGALAKLLSDAVIDAYIAFDGDDAGRLGATKLKAEIDATEPASPACVVELPDGRDLADCLAAEDDPVAWLANALMDADAAATEEVLTTTVVDAAEVDGAGGEDQKDSKPGRVIAFPAVEPWPGPVDGADLADAVAAVICRHVALPDEATVAATLWVCLSHVHDSSRISPLLAITSPTSAAARPRC